MIPIIKTKSKHYLGFLFKADIPSNRNYVYDVEAMALIVDTFRNKKLYGYFDSQIYDAIDLQKVSHYVTDMAVEDDLLRINIKTLDTPLGSMIDSSYDNGIGMKLVLDGSAKWAFEKDQRRITNLSVYGISVLKI